MRDASIMRDRSRQRACRVTRTKRHVHAIVGVRALSNVRPEATSTDVCARCERDARSQSSACMPRDARRQATRALLVLICVWNFALLLVLQQYGFVALRRCVCCQRVPPALPGLHEQCC